MTTETQPKKRGKLKKILLPALAVLVIGGACGGGGYVYASSLGAHPVEEKPDLPKLVLKDGEEVEAPASGRLTHTEKYKVTYHPIEKTFTTNLRGDTGFAQVDLAVSTFYDDTVVEALTEHDIAIRNAIVLELANTDGAEIETVVGKKALADRLRDRINATLKEKTGFGGIAEVYFTKLVLQ
jgi:flagellar FliL protein